VKSGKRSKRSGSGWELTVVATDPPPRRRRAGWVEAALALSGTVGDGQARLLLPAGGKRAGAVVFAEFEGELDATDAAKIAHSLTYFQSIFGEEARVRVVQMREIPLPWGRTAWVGLLRLRESELTPGRAMAYFGRVFRSLVVRPVRIAVEIWGQE
jgi:hypothetical protein